MSWLLLIALLSLSLAACGSDDSASTEDAARQARELAERTQQVAGDVAQTGRTLADDPRRMEEAREQLGDLEERARDLAGQAEELPESTNVRDEQIALIPHGRDFTSLVTQAPGANMEAKLGGLSIDGASGSENRFIIDGAETTDMVHGLSGTNLIVDFVDEVQVKSSGYTAEYGGAMGGENAHHVGHAALSVDGVLLAEIATGVHAVSGLAPGGHTLRVELVNNDGTPLTPPVYNAFPFTVN